MKSGNTVKKIGCQVGCLNIVLFILVMWVLIFGISIQGKHYQIGCSCNKGVTVGE